MHQGSDRSNYLNTTFTHLSASVWPKNAASTHKYAQSLVNVPTSQAVF